MAELAEITDQNFEAEVLNSDTPVIMFTAIEEKGDVMAAIERGATDYVLKDTGVIELLRRVKHHLEDRPTRTAAPPASAQQRPRPDLSRLKVQTIRLDSDTAQARKHAEAASNPGVSLDKRRALVAHADNGKRQELSEIASRIGLTVAEVGTAREAIEAIENQRPRLLILGSSFADMTGLDLLKSVNSQIKAGGMAVVMTAVNRSRESQRRARYYGVQEYVLEPWEAAQLDMTLRTALARTRTRPSAATQAAA